MTRPADPFKSGTGEADLGTTRTGKVIVSGATSAGKPCLLAELVNSVRVVSIGNPIEIHLRPSGATTKRRT
jgi:hypothetical protein